MSSHPPSESITVICPVYNEQEVIRDFVDELSRILSNLPEKYRWDVLLVVDRSTDSTAEIVRAMAREKPWLRALIMSSRFGHQMALLAGLDHSSSDIAIMMDSDLQHPPELIPELIREYELGHDVVHAVRIDTTEISWAKRLSSSLFYKSINTISDVPIQENAADFRLLSRKVVEVFQNSIREQNLFLRGMIKWVGFDQSSVSFTVKKRHAGSSKYSTGRMFRLGMAGVLSFSKKPLQAAIVLGSAFALFAFLNGLLTLGNFLLGRPAPSGWTTVVILLSGFSGIQLIFLGVIGEYIGGIFDEVKNRPKYIIDEEINPP